MTEVSPGSGTVVEAGDRLLFFANSPGGRIARVFVREWGLPIAEEVVPFSAPEAVVRLSPLGHVPVLVLGGAPLFPTLLVLERLWEMAGSPETAYDPGRERQTLATILAGGEALVSALHQRWAGLGPEGTNNLGFDPGRRNFERFVRTLDWLESGRLRDGLTLVGVAAACFMIWSDARGGPAWWGRPRLDALAAALEERDSFRRTQPKLWRPGEAEVR